MKVRLVKALADSDFNECKVKNIKWKTIFGILLILTGTVFEFQILFGLFYIIWAIVDLKTGYAYVFEEINRWENQILYWLIVVIWLGSGIYIFTSSFINNWLPYFLK